MQTLKSEVKNFTIEIKKLNYLYDNLASGLVAIFALSTIIFYTFNGLVAYQNLLIWFVLNILLLSLRTIILLRYKKSPISSKNFLNYYWSFFFLAILSASLWGSSAFFILPSQIEYQMIILLLLGGLASGSAISLSSRVEIFYVYILLSLTPFAYTFYLLNTDAYDVLAISILLYIFILFILSKKISHNIINNIVLAQQNKNLIKKLEDKATEANIANRAKSEFLSVMSHEIRTPLNAIMGFVQILLKSEKDAKKKKYLDTINKSSKTLTNVINDILDISKIEAGKFTLEMIQFNPKDEFNSVYLLFEQNALEKNITIKNNISSDLPTIVQTDILRIKQILSNLLSNAIKFTPENKNIELSIHFNKENSSLYFEVIDEGIGISKSNIQNITKAFTQADSSTAREYGGSGLGLSIVSSLLKLLNSELKIQSKLEHGSKFSFEIKVKVVNEKQENTQIINSSHNAKYSNKKILVAEDNKTNQMLINIILSELNISVTIANDGIEAEDIFKKDTFDMIFMDINMPRKNGSEAMIDIKKFEKSRNTTTPIVALTANAVSGDRQRYLDEGFDDYLSKPIDTQKLADILKKYFN